MVKEANITIRQSKKYIKTDTKKPPGHLKISSGSSQMNGVGRKLKVKQVSASAGQLGQDADRVLQFLRGTV